VPPTPTSPTGAWRIAETDGVQARVRAAPSLDAAVVMRVDSGTVVEPLSETASADGYAWRRISVDGTTGWIVTTLLVEPAPPPRTPVYVVAAVGERGLNVRSSPSLTGQIVGALQEGQVVEVVGEPRDGDDRQWLQVRTDAVTGWVIAQAIAER
jgi:SH3-like domain-containing protein